MSKVREYVGKAMASNFIFQVFYWGISSVMRLMVIRGMTLAKRPDIWAILRSAIMISLISTRQWAKRRETTTDSGALPLWMIAYGLAALSHIDSDIIGMRE